MAKPATTTPATTPANPTHIKDLIPDPKNRRKHNPRNIGMIADSLQAVGAARSISIDENDVIMAGNGVVEAAAQVGITKVKVVEAAGDEIVAVKRRGLTEQQKRDLAMYDNRAAELAEWSVDQLEADVAAGMDMGAFFTDKELKELFANASPVVPITVPRPAEIVWVLLAVPMDEWPEKQGLVEALQDKAQFSALVVRPKP